MHFTTTALPLPLPLSPTALPLLHYLYRTTSQARKRVEKLEEEEKASGAILAHNTSVFKVGLARLDMPNPNPSTSPNPSPNPYPNPP